MRTQESVKTKGEGFGFVQGAEGNLLCLEHDGKEGPRCLKKVGNTQIIIRRVNT